MFYYYLLRAHAGYSESGELLGVPCITEYLTVNSQLNLPRASFQACVEQIYSDLAKAEELLPLEYKDETEVPAKYQSITQDVGKFNNAVGAKFNQLFNGLIARSYRARTALLAASPAFQDASNVTTWADAANAAAEVINYNGGIGGIAEDGVEYYDSKIADKLEGGVNPKEIIWRQNVASENAQESSNFPPSLNGNGNMNPSQNLVDAFQWKMVILLRRIILMSVAIKRIIHTINAIPVWQSISYITEVRLEWLIRLSIQDVIREQMMVSM